MPSSSVFLMPRRSRRQVLRGAGALALVSLVAACSSTPAASPTAAPAAAPTAAPAPPKVAPPKVAPPKAAPTTAPAPAPTQAAAPAATTAGQSAATVTVAFWNPMSGQIGDVVNALVKNFNGSGQGVQVKSDFSGDYFATQDKLLAGLAAGKVPDLTIMEIGGIVTFATNGALLPLDSLMKTVPNFNPGDFIETLMLNARYKGVTYSLPFNRSTPLFYYNKDMFKTAGLDPEKAPASWDDVRTAAQKLTKKNGSNVAVYGYEPPLDYWFYASMTWDWGGEIVSPDGKQALFNQPAGVDALTYWNDLVHKDKTAKVPPGQGFNSWNAAKADFIGGKAGMIVTSTGDIAYLTKNAKFPVGTGFIPKQKQYGAATGGANICMFTKSPANQQQAAWKFVSWVTEPDQVVYFSQNTGYLVTRTSLINSDKMQSYYKQNPNYKTALEQLQYVHPTPQNPGWPKVQNNLVNLYLQKVVVGGEPVKQALDQLVAESNKSLQGS